MSKNQETHQGNHKPLLRPPTRSHQIQFLLQFNSLPSSLFLSGALPFSNLDLKKELLDMSIELATASADHSVKAIPTHGGRYVRYNVYGNLFEVSRKYVPPIRPVGRGAYGIVW